MPKGPRIDKGALRRAGLELMRLNGTPLTEASSQTSAMLYTMPEGQTVRMRTTNDHLLIAVADTPSSDARLNIEGTDWLLVVMPVIERTPGDVTAYLVPTKEAVDAARSINREWSASNPRTSGQNRTWNIRLRQYGPKKDYDYAEQWEKYRLQGRVSTLSAAEGQDAAADRDADLRPLSIAQAKPRLAAYYDCPIEAIEITIRG